MGLRVAIVLGSLGSGGAERQAVRLARHLVSGEGAEVLVVGLGQPGMAEGWCEEAGVRWQVLARLPADGHPALLLRGATLLCRLRRFQPDLLLPFTLPCNLLAGWLWRACGAASCVWGQRDAGIHRAWWPLELSAARLTPCFVANSEGGRRFLTGALGVPAGKVRVVPNAVEVPSPGDSRETWRRRLGLPEEALLACMVATLSPEKDHVTLLRAWREVADRWPGPEPPRLVLAGAHRGSAGALKELVSGLRLSDLVQMPGEVSDVGGLLEACDLAVFSSRSEGCPNGVLEPMAAGLPVVATDNPGVREVLGAGASGQIVPGETRALAEGILGMLASPSSREAAGRGNRRRAEEGFAPAKVHPRMVEVLAAQAARRLPLREGRPVVAPLPG